MLRLKVSTLTSLMLRPQVDQNWLISKPPWWNQRMRWSLVYNSFLIICLVHSFVWRVISIGEFALILLQMKLAALRNEVEAFAVKFRLPGQQVGNFLLTPWVVYDFNSRFCRCAVHIVHFWQDPSCITPWPIFLPLIYSRLNSTTCTYCTSKNIL